MNTPRASGQEERMRPHRCRESASMARDRRSWRARRSMERRGRALPSVRSVSATCEERVRPFRCETDNRGVQPFGMDTRLSSSSGRAVGSFHPLGRPPMRVSAVVFGALVTLGSGYVAAAAVESVGVAQPIVPVPVAPAPAGQVIWYGGVLEPVVVSARATDQELVARTPAELSCRRSTATQGARRDVE